MQKENPPQEKCKIENKIKCNPKYCVVNFCEVWSKHYQENRTRNGEKTVQSKIEDFNLTVIYQSRRETSAVVDGRIWGWGHISEYILNYYNNKCHRCNEIENLDIHHVRPVSFYSGVIIAPLHIQFVPTCKKHHCGGAQ